MPCLTLRALSITSLFGGFFSPIILHNPFDAFMWQKLDTKSKFIGQVLSGAKGARHAEDIDNPLPEAAEMKAAASGDPRSYWSIGEAGAPEGAPFDYDAAEADTQYGRKPKWTSHSLRRGADTAARVHREETGATEAQIDIFFGWHEKILLSFLLMLLRSCSRTPHMLFSAHHPKLPLKQAPQGGAGMARIVNSLRTTRSCH